jgi:hypothetical protein
MDAVSWSFYDEKFFPLAGEDCKNEPLSIGVIYVTVHVPSIYP